MTHSSKLTYYFKMYRGLLTAMHRVFHDCSQRFCLRHIYANFKVAGFRGGDLKAHVDAAAYSYSKPYFDDAMARLKEDCEEAWEWLSKINPKHGARHAMDTNCKTDLVVNNLSEIFNNFIIDVKDKPIVTMIDGIRTKLMARFEAKRIGIQKAGWDITSTFAEKLEIEKSNSKYSKAICAAKGLWQVASGTRTYPVNLRAKTCGCRKWDLTGLPCKHAVCAIYKAKGHPEDYVSDFFKKPLYIQTHNEIVYPVPGQHDWVQTDTPDIDPPHFFVHPGRRKKNRRKGQDEQGEPRGKGRMSTSTCSNCKKQGHTYTSCANPLKPELAIRKSRHKSNRGFPTSAATPAPAAQPTPASASAPTPSKCTGRRGGAQFKPPRAASATSTSAAPAPAPSSSARGARAASAPAKAAPAPSSSARAARAASAKVAAAATAREVAASTSAPTAHATSTRPTRKTAGTLPARYENSKMWKYFNCSRRTN